MLSEIGQQDVGSIFASPVIETFNWKPILVNLKLSNQFCSQSKRSLGRILISST